MIFLSLYLEIQRRHITISEKQSECLLSLWCDLCSCTYNFVVSPVFHLKQVTIVLRIWLNVILFITIDVFLLNQGFDEQILLHTNLLCSISEVRNKPLSTKLSKYSAFGCISLFFSSMAFFSSCSFIQRFALSIGSSI